MSVMPPASQSPSSGPQYPLVEPGFKPIYQAQQPRFVVKIDGNPYLGESFTYSQNSHGATDTASLTLPIDGAANFPGIAPNSLYPDWTTSIERSSALGNSNKPVVVELWSGQPTDPGAFSPNNLSGLILRFRGIVDQYSVQLRENKTSFSCRSLAFPLTSTKITTPFPREDSTTTVAFIQQQAKRFGLNVAPPILGQAPALMIDVLGGEFITGVRGWYIWDLMLQCAQFDGVNIWVDRTGTIRYEASSLIKRDKIYYIWGENITSLDGTHSPQFSKNIRVQVHSWTKRTRTTSATRVTTSANGSIKVSSYTRTVTSTPIFGTTSSLVTSISSNGTVTVGEGTVSGGGAGTGTGSESETGLERYIYFPKNLTLPQCQAMAQQLWLDISQHEYSIKLRAPVTTGNLPLMDVDALLVVSGHPMKYFNGGFYPREIVETFDVQNGWHWEIDALNHLPPQNGV